LCFYLDARASGARWNARLSLAARAGPVAWRECAYLRTLLTNTGPCKNRMLARGFNGVSCTLLCLCLTTNSGHGWLQMAWADRYFLFSQCRKIYALNAVGPIPEELQNLTRLTNL
jgi:hypothetical protein